MEAWLNAIDNNTLVKASTTERIFSPVQTNNGKTVTYGYGWEFHKYRSMDIVVHGGSWVGFNTLVLKFPERNTWFVGFSNTDAISADTAVNSMIDHHMDFK